MAHNSAKSARERETTLDAVSSDMLQDVRLMVLRSHFRSACADCFCRFDGRRNTNVCAAKWRPPERKTTEVRWQLIPDPRCRKSGAAPHSATARDTWVSNLWTIALDLQVRSLLVSQGCSATSRCVNVAFGDADAVYVDSHSRAIRYNLAQHAAG